MNGHFNKYPEIYIYADQASTSQRKNNSSIKKNSLQIVPVVNSRPNKFDVLKKALHTQAFAMSISVRTQECDGKRIYIL